MLDTVFWTIPPESMLAHNILFFILEISEITVVKHSTYFSLPSSETDELLISSIAYFSESSITPPQFFKISFTYVFISVATYNAKGDFGSVWIIV